MGEHEIVTPSKTNIAPKKWMVGILLSFSERPNFQGLVTQEGNHLSNKTAVKIGQQTIPECFSSTFWGLLKVKKKDNAKKHTLLCRASKHFKPRNCTNIYNVISKTIQWKANTRDSRPRWIWPHQVCFSIFGWLHITPSCMSTVHIYSMYIIHVHIHICNYSKCV